MCSICHLAVCSFICVFFSFHFSSIFSALTKWLQGWAFVFFLLSAFICLFWSYLILIFPQFEFSFVLDSFSGLVSFGDSGKVIVMIEDWQGANNLLCVFFLFFCLFRFSFLILFNVNFHVLDFFYSLVSSSKLIVMMEDRQMADSLWFFLLSFLSSVFICIFCSYF